MAIQVTTGETQVVSVSVRNPTVVKSVTVGTPISSIRMPGTTLEGLFDVNVDSDLRPYDILTWVLADGKWRNKPAGFFFDSDINVLTLRIEANDSDIAELLAADSSFASQITVITTNISNLTSDVAALYAFDSDQRIINQIREDFDSDLLDALDSQRLDYIARDANLQSQINNFEIVFDNADSDINARLDSQRLDYIARDTVLRNSFEDADSDIRDRIDSDYALLQSIRTALRNADSDIIDRIDSDYALLQSIRANLQNQIDSNETFFRVADANIRARLDSDYALLQSIRANLQNQIDSNETFFRNVDSDLQFQIDSNETYFRNIDSALQSMIDSNYGVFLVARSLLQAQIDSNETLFRAQDSALDARLDSNYMAFIAAIDSLQAVDSDLQVMIDSNYDVLIVTRNNLENADSALDARLDSDYALLQSIRANLQNQIDSNETFFRVADANIRARIDSDYALLQSIRANLQNQIDSNEAFFRDIDSDILDRIDSDYALLQSIRANLQNQIDSNETFFRDVDSDLQDAIDSLNSAIITEKIQRISADSNLRDDVDSNYQRLISLTTSNIPEGSRLYYTDERVDDRVAVLIVAGTGIIKTYNDADGTLTLTARIDSGDIATLINSSVNPLQAQINSDGADIAQLFGITTSLQNQINSDGTAIQVLKNTAVSLQNQINSDGTAIQVLKNTAVSLQNQINSDGSDIFDLTTRVVALENDPGVDSAAVFALIDQRIDSNDFVKLIGNQTINNIKTFNDSAVFNDVIGVARAIGIGTNNPNKYNTLANLELRDDSGGSIEFRRTDGTVLGEIYNLAGDLVIDAQFDDLRLQTGSVTRMFIDQDGNTSFGSLATSAVTGYTVVSINNNTNGGNLRFRTNDNTVGAVFNLSDRIIFGSTVTSAFTAIQSGGTTRMRIDGVNGNIVIGNGNTRGDSDAILDIVSTVRGILIPRMTTTQRNAITTPPTGLIVFDTTTNKLSRRGPSTWDYLTVDSDLRERGLTGGGTDRAFLVFRNTINTSYTVDSNCNALTAGPITIATGAVVTVPTTATWTIV